jgi:hypothetical protein
MKDVPARVQQPAYSNESVRSQAVVSADRHQRTEGQFPFAESAATQVGSACAMETFCRQRVKTELGKPLGLAISGGR